MADIVSPEKRSRMMAGIRGKNTRPEIFVRKGLHALGFRYRLHVKDLPGKPDIVFPKYGAAIFVHGCFWHGHDCHLFCRPKSREEFWRAKIETNQKNDEKSLYAISEQGWRTLVIWECAIKGKIRLPSQETILRAAEWLRGTSVCGEIRGSEPIEPKGQSLRQSCTKAPEPSLALWC